MNRIVFVFVCVCVVNAVTITVGNLCFVTWDFCDSHCVLCLPCYFCVNDTCVSVWYLISASSGSTMWFTTPENSFRMSSFKTKIRRRKYALTRGNSSAGDKKKEKEECHGAKGVAADWEFVNFNPVIYGRRGLPQNLSPPGTPLEEDEGDHGTVVKRRPTPSPPASRPSSRPPSWLAALPYHFVMEDEEGNSSRFWHSLCFCPTSSITRVQWLKGFQRVYNWLYFLFDLVFRCNHKINSNVNRLAIYSIKFPNLEILFVLKWPYKPKRILWKACLTYPLVRKTVFVIFTIVSFIVICM